MKTKGELHLFYLDEPIAGASASNAIFVVADMGRARPRRTRASDSVGNTPWRVACSRFQAFQRNSMRLIINQFRLRSMVPHGFQFSVFGFQQTQMPASFHCHLSILSLSKCSPALLSRASVWEIHRRGCGVTQRGLRRQKRIQNMLPQTRNQMDADEDKR